MATDPLHAGDGSRPVPDPTTLTTEALRKDISALREIIEARLDGMDKATGLLQATQNRFPSDIDTKVGHLDMVFAERFRSIEKQFVQLATQTDKIAELAQKAIDAALQAAKEAVAEQNKSNAASTQKSDTATAKLLDQIQLQLQAQERSMNEKWADVKDRLTRIEGTDTGKTAAHTTQQTGNNFTAYLVFGVVGTLLSLIALAAALLRKPS